MFKSIIRTFIIQNHIAKYEYDVTIYNQLIQSDIGCPICEHCKRKKEGYQHRMDSTLKAIIKLEKLKKAKTHLVITIKN